MLPFHDFVRSHDPLVSILIPCYNKAEYLAETLHSAANQTYGFVEIVVIDDGSTDSSPQIVEEFKRANPNKQIKFLTKQNGGISDSRNFGMGHVSGRIVMVLDGDDIASPEFVKRGVELMRSEGSNLVCCDVEIFGAEQGEWVPSEYDEYALRYNNSIPTLVMFDIELWRAVGGYKKAFAFNEDWDFFIGITRHSLKVSRIREKLFRYRVTHSGLAHNYIKDSWPRSVSLMATSNHDLYPVEEVLWAHEQLKAIPDNWLKRHETQDALHSSEWLLKFWRALAHEGRGSVDEALILYREAAELSNFKNWQPIFRLAQIAESRGNIAEMKGLLYRCRTMRPDVSRFVKEKIG